MLCTKTYPGRTGVRGRREEEREGDELAHRSLLTSEASPGDEDVPLPPPVSQGKVPLLSASLGPQLLRAATRTAFSPPRSPHHNLRRLGTLARCRLVVDSLWLGCTPGVSRCSSGCFRCPPRLFTLLPCPCFPFLLVRLLWYGEEQQDPQGDKPERGAHSGPGRHGDVCETSLPNLFRLDPFRGTVPLVTQEQELDSACKVSKGHQGMRSQPRTGSELPVVSSALNSGIGESEQDEQNDRNPPGIQRPESAVL